MDVTSDRYGWEPPELRTQAVLNRPRAANYIIDESFAVDTNDHEDHTFCGIMFDFPTFGSPTSPMLNPMIFLKLYINVILSKSSQKQTYTISHNK